MGVWVCSKEDIIEALEKALENLEGEVYKKDYIFAVNHIGRKYKNFTK